MTAKKKPAARVRKRLAKTPALKAIDAGAAFSDQLAGEEPKVALRPEPPKFGLGFIHLHQGTIVLGVSGPSFTTFRNKADAAEWLRGLARSIETSYPTE
jgi:hypothetical protein